MVEHILKLYTEEPEKLKKAFIKSLSLFNVLLLSFWLYRNFIGKFYFLPFNDFTGIYDFFCSGKVLIALFTFSIAYYSFEFIVSMLLLCTNLLLRKFSKKLVFTGNDIDGLLSFFNVIKLDKNSKEVSKGKNFEVVYKIVQQFDSETALQEVSEFVSFQFKDVFCASTLIYFFILPNEFHNSYLNWVLSILIFFMLFTEVALERIFESILKHSKGISVGFDFIAINETTVESLSQLNTNVENISVSKNLKYGVKFEIGSNPYRLIYIPLLNEGNVSSEERISYFIEKFPEAALIIKEDLYNKMENKAESLCGKNGIIVIRDIADLKGSIRRFVKKNQLK
jgi:hypothetical protein